MAEPAEGDATPPGRGRAPGGNEAALPNGRGRDGLEDPLERLPEIGRQLLEAELLLFERRGREDAPREGVERVDLLAQQPRGPLRDLLPVRRPRDAPASSRTGSEGAPGAEAAEVLDGEERQPLGAREERAPELLPEGVRDGVHERVDEGAVRALCEADEPRALHGPGDLLDRRLLPAPPRGPEGLLRAVGGEDEEPAPRERAPETSEERERGAIRPVQVVEEEEERPSAGVAEEDRLELRDEDRRIGGGRTRAGRREDPGGERRVLLREGVREVVRPLFGRAGRRLSRAVRPPPAKGPARKAAERLAEREAGLQRDHGERAAPAADGHLGRARKDPRGEGGDERGLARARLARDEDRAPAPGPGIPERTLQQSELPFPAGEDRVRADGPGRRRARSAPALRRGLRCDRGRPRRSR